MPTYEYRCDKCGEQFEVVQSFKDRPLRRHRQCGGGLAKVFHSRGVVFKGSGFYSTDSRPKPVEAKAVEAKTGDSKSGESSKNGSSDSSKKDSKSDAAPKSTEKASAATPASKSDSSS
ncbi:MAG TPA: FmdB family zinc ribbon protein [Acidimicrobiia bacterium]|nr:FmdB family zinc ribbon protein [Acidimicrobiia bacterium]